MASSTYCPTRNTMIYGILIITLIFSSILGIVISQMMDSHFEVSLSAEFTAKTNSDQNTFSVILSDDLSNPDIYKSLNIDYNKSSGEISKTFTQPNKDKIIGFQNINANMTNSSQISNYNFNRTFSTESQTIDTFSYTETTMNLTYFDVNQGTNDKETAYRNVTLPPPSGIEIPLLSMSTKYNVQQNFILDNNIYNRIYVTIVNKMGIDLNHTIINLQLVRSDDYIISERNYTANWLSYGLPTYLNCLNQSVRLDCNTYSYIVNISIYNDDFPISGDWTAKMCVLGQSGSNYPTITGVQRYDTDIEWNLGVYDEVMVTCSKEQAFETCTITASFSGMYSIADYAVAIFPSINFLDFDINQYTVSEVSALFKNLTIIGNTSNVMLYGNTSTPSTYYDSPAISFGDPIYPNNGTEITWQYGIYPSYAGYKYEFWLFSDNAFTVQINNFTMNITCFGEPITNESTDITIEFNNTSTFTILISKIETDYGFDQIELIIVNNTYIVDIIYNNDFLTMISNYTMNIYVNTIKRTVFYSKNLQGDFVIPLSFVNTQIIVYSYKDESNLVLIDNLKISIYM